jgi:hypothetical protein
MIANDIIRRRDSGKRFRAVGTEPVNFPTALEPSRGSQSGKRSIKRANQLSKLTIIGGLVEVTTDEPFCGVQDTGLNKGLNKTTCSPMGTVFIRGGIDGPNKKTINPNKNPLRIF